MKKALINIDYTNDFVASNGTLTCGEPGQEIEQEITRVTQEFINNDDYVVFAIDLHQNDEQYHPEAKLFPPHNIANTKGRELYGNLKEVYDTNKLNANVYWMDKTRYSAFAGTDLDIKLRERGINELHIVGVCTDICCLHTLIDAFALNYKLVIHENAVASFNQVGHDWALQHFKTALGAEIV